MLFFQSLILAFAIRGPISGLQNTYGSMDVVLAHKHPVSMIDSVDFFFILSTETALITVYDFLHGLERSYMKRLMHSTSVVIRSGQMRHPEDSDIFRYQLCFRFFLPPYQIMILAFQGIMKLYASGKAFLMGRWARLGLQRCLRLSHMAWTAFFFFRFRMMDTPKLL